MANTALCIRCGTFKKSFVAACPGCDFLPTDDVDIAKSRILDFPYYFTIGPNHDILETGRTVAELQVIAKQIKSGTTYAFQDQEVAGVLAVMQEIKQTTPLEIWLTLARWLGPPVLLASTLYYVGYRYGT